MTKKYKMSPEEMECELTRICEEIGCTNYAARGYRCCNTCMGRGDDKPEVEVRREKLRREKLGKPERVEDEA